jgi:ribosomal protein L37AE/L43A
MKGEPGKCAVPGCTLARRYPCGWCKQVVCAIHIQGAWVCSECSTEDDGAGGSLYTVFPLFPLHLE